MGIAILHLRNEVEVIATALARAVVTEPAVLRQGYFEGVLAGAFVNRAGAFEAIAVASAAHLGREAVMVEHLLKRNGRFDRSKINELFGHDNELCVGVCGTFAGCKHLRSSSYQVVQITGS